MSTTPGKPSDPATSFDGVKIGRAATRALTASGYTTLAELPADLGELAKLHGVGPKAVQLLGAARRD